jgi:hypothetical protein
VINKNTKSSAPTVIQPGFLPMQTGCFSTIKQLIEYDEIIYSDSTKTMQKIHLTPEGLFYLPKN